MTHGQSADITLLIRFGPAVLGADATKLVQSDDESGRRVALALVALIMWNVIRTADRRTVETAPSDQPSERARAMTGIAATMTTGTGSARPL